MKPANVAKAEQLLRISSILGLCKLILLAFSLKYLFPSDRLEFFLLFLFLEGVIGFGVMMFLAYAIGKKKNWARIIILILYIISLLLSPICIIFWFYVFIIGGVINIAQFVIKDTAIYFLFQKSSLDWIKQEKQAQHE